MADPKSLTNAQLRSETARQQQLAERDVPGAKAKVCALAAEAWRRFDISNRDESTSWWAQ
jgi:hypothetical protein